MKAFWAASAVVAAGLVALAVSLSSADGEANDGAPARARVAATTTAPPNSQPPTTVAPTTTAAPATTVPTTVGNPVTGAAPSLVAGQWSPIGRAVNGVATLTATVFQSPSGGPPTGVVRITGAVTKVVLYAGTAEPGGTWPHQGAVAEPERATLVAAFNGGFHTSSSGGGWYDNGRLAVALRTGAASLAIRADGSATVGAYGRDVSLTADVVSIRQNLGLLVDGGANMSAGAAWGAVLGGGSRTWRSGVGVDSSGNLIFAGGPGLDASALADVLIHAGAVRAMQLDINPQWVSFSYFTSSGSGSNLLPTMNYSPAHWLKGSSRDFFAVFTR